MLTYGYARCSTNETRQDIDRQKRELKQLGATDATIYFEYESGSKINRPELMKLLNIIKTGDVIVTTEVSRITRSTKQLCEIIETVKTKQLKLIIGSSMTIDCRGGELDPMTNAFLQMAGVFAELEKNMISQRVKSGLINARAKGRFVGRPKLKYSDIPKKVIENYDNYKNNIISKTDYAKICNISRPTLDKYLMTIFDC
jgi:DNA invertase Pin-like site-specific DNA recombinase